MYSSIGLFEWTHGRKGLAMGSCAERKTSLFAIHSDGQALPVAVDVDHLQIVAWQQQQQRTKHGNAKRNERENQRDGEQMGMMVRMDKRTTPSADGRTLPLCWWESRSPASQLLCLVLLSCLLDKRKKHGQDINRTLIVVNIHLKTTRIQNAPHGGVLPFLSSRNYKQVFMLCSLHECLFAWPSLQSHKPVTQCTNVHMHDVCPQHTFEKILDILWAGVG